ncbi:S8 family serine peptidase [Mesorhizobium sp. M0292]|uniref:S8 family serine peptidase n=1 Tax=Mesorhizobium sp. M0292 TaxID=2956929 RepID=UPI00333609FF
MATLDPDLELLLQYEPQQRLVQLMLDWSGSDEDLTKKGITLLAPIEDGTALVEMSLGTVGRLLDDPDIGYLQLLPNFIPELDVSRKVVNTPNEVVTGTDGKQSFKGLTGKGVIIGLIDADIDVFHQSLRNPDGSSRFLTLWDMNPRGKTAPIDGLGAPDGFQKGLVYSKADIDFALSKPISGETKQQAKRREKLSGNLRMLRGSGHGTRVASIAAGNGRLSTGAYSKTIGIAPEADLIGVVKRSPHDWAMAMRFLRKLMQGKPAVMNLSAGEHHGPHLPDGQVERWFKSFIDSSGISLVKSAGNGGGLGGHATGLIKKNTAVSLQLTMTAAVAKRASRIRVQIWYGYGGSDPRLGATITPPNGSTYDVPYDGLCTAPASLIMASNRKRPDQLGLGAVVLWLKPIAGTWTIRLSAPKTADVKWHAWITWGALLRRGVSFGPAGLVSDATTITVPVAVPNMVTVASFVTKDRKGNAITDYKIAGSSAQGPAADAVTPALTLAAPGEFVVAAIPPDPKKKEPPPGTTDRYDLGAGTSFAAPHVTGAIALMLEKNPTLTPAQIVTILRTDPNKSLDDNVWGAGRLDVDKALKLVTAP